VSQIGGAFLILIGLLLLTGVWDHWMNELRGRFGSGSIGSGL
jgi:cytochrome c-type biogenesis protein